MSSRFRRRPVHQRGSVQSMPASLSNLECRLVSGEGQVISVAQYRVALFVRISRVAVHDIITFPVAFIPAKNECDNELKDDQESY